MGGDGSAAYTANVLQSPKRFGFVASARLTRFIRARGERRVQGRSRRQGAVTLADWVVMARGSGTASMEAVTIDTPNIDTRYEMDFIPYCAHDSGFSRRPAVLFGIFLRSRSQPPCSPGCRYLKPSRRLSFSPGIVVSGKIESLLVSPPSPGIYANAPKTPTVALFETLHEDG